MTIKEWTDLELEYWKKEKKKPLLTRWNSYCQGRIDAAKSALKFVTKLTKGTRNEKN